MQLSLVEKWLWGGSTMEKNYGITEESGGGTAGAEERGAAAEEQHGAERPHVRSVMARELRGETVRAELWLAAPCRSAPFRSSCLPTSSGRSKIAFLKRRNFNPGTRVEGDHFAISVLFCKKHPWTEGTPPKMKGAVL